MRHALVVGPPGVGKSTLIRRVVEELHPTLCGFLTKKEPALADPVLGSPVYYHPLGEPRRYCPDHLLGHCKNRCPQVYPEAFHNLAPQVAAMGGGQLLVMDEIGFMETCSPAFCQAVLAHLDGEVPVLAAVKDMDRPFLNQVRQHPNAQVFSITRENRDQLFVSILAFVKAQLEE